MKKNETTEIKEIPGAVALITAEVIFLIIASLVSISTLIVIIRRIFIVKTTDFDENAFDLFASLVTDTNTHIALVITFLGSYLFMVTAWFVLMGYFLFVRKNKRRFINIFIIALSNFGLMVGLKFFFNRPRPLIPLLNEIPGLSFPSGHAFMGTIYYGLLISIVYREVKTTWKKWLLIFLLLCTIILVGLSRVYLRVHYLSDVLAGFCFGTLSLIIFIWLIKRMEKYNALKLGVLRK
ncbi:phosphatase PAP2 family protein [Lacibacter sp. H375]|uniref:phosphatase PAP2 family protein n=1 Tax=Lacibacter sp. H375 TaxID=3133424 RepID=UPI0030C631F3